MNYTKYGYRIEPLAQGDGYNWLFLPGGPGLGSEYLREFCQSLDLPGSVLLLDFPRDGTNTQGELGIKYWQDGLIDLLKDYVDPILVTHSFSGMFALNLPELESNLRGLVLMNTTTQNSFFMHVAEMQQKHQLPDLVPAATQYHLEPSDQTYREFWNTYKYYCFTAEEMAEGEKMIQLLVFNNKAYHYAIENFYAHYQCQWYSQTLPIMTIASEYDYICPPQIFIKDPYFSSENITNKMIRQAGHCPWLRHIEEVKTCFKEFINNQL